MRVGLIGAGRIGASHAGLLAAHPEVSSLVVASRRRARAEALAGAVGGDTADTPVDLVRRVDAVVITAATDAHADLILLAAEAGLPTFCEKPIALDMAATEEVIERVRDAGIELQVGFHRRFDPGYRRAREAVASGAVGVPYLVRTASYDPEPSHEDFIPGSGGIFRDFLIHDLDAARFVLGRDIEEVFAVGSVLGFDVYARYDDVDTAVVLVRFRGGATAVMGAARHDPEGCDVRMEVLGSEDSLAVGWGPRTPLRLLDPAARPLPGPPFTGFLDRFREAFAAEMAAFVDLVAGKIENPCPPEDALEAMRAAVACDLSRARGRPVAMDEV